jgi:phage anti-repressor protein
MEATLNIVELIENNPIARLSDTYQNKLLDKIKTNFTNNEQQLFIASFYCYLNYDQKNDFVIDLDNVWKWLGFYQKYNAKYTLEKNFIIDKDYKIIAPEYSGAKKDTRGGHNKEIIMLNINTFKRFCLKAGTKKADEIHDYYIKLEETLQEVIQEESNEIRLQLDQKDKLLEKSEIDKIKIREKTLLEQFPNNTQCVYYGIIDNLSAKNEKLIKFGISNN